jgi:hypothetical protein
VVLATATVEAILHNLVANNYTATMSPFTEAWLTASLRCCIGKPNHHIIWFTDIGTWEDPAANDEANKETFGWDYGYCLECVIAKETKVFSELLPAYGTLSESELYHQDMQLLSPTTSSSASSSFCQWGLLPSLPLQSQVPSQPCGGYCLLSLHFFFLPPLDRHSGGARKSHTIDIIGVVQKHRHIHWWC